MVTERLLAVIEYSGLSQTAFAKKLVQLRRTCGANLMGKK